MYEWGSTASRLEPLWGGTLLYNNESLEIPDTKKFLVLILSTSEGWKAGSTLEPPNGFER